MLIRKNGHSFFRLVAAFFLISGQICAQSGSRTPAEVETRVESILSQMTLEEKVDLLGGVDDFYIRGVPRLGVPRLRMADGPMGVRNFGPATSMAAGIGLSATWNPALAERVGTEIGRDARAKGVHLLLGPGVNIYRSPMNGRNFEYFGEDPFLASRIAVGYIRGVQSQGVSATVKHFMGNNSEFDRHNVDSVIDERTLREIYLPVFEAAVKEAHVGAIMDSYNLTNGAHLTQNGYLNIDVVKKEWGFNGIIMSDWTSTYDAVAAANGGLDLEMPSPAFMNRANLLPAIQQGKVSVATVDDKVRRILRLAVRFGWLNGEQTDLSVPRYNQQGREVALQAAGEGVVLLKNNGNLLPLDKAKIKSVAIIGPDAYPAVPVGGGSARVQPFAAISFLEGLSNYLGMRVPVYYSRGIPTLSEMAEATNFSTEPANGQAGLHVEYFENAELQGPPSLARTEGHVDVGRAAQLFPEHTRSDRWTGYYTPQKAGLHEIFVESTGEDGGFYRLYVDGQLLFDNWAITTAIMNSAALQLEAKPHKIVLEHHGRSNWLGTRLKLGIVAADSVVRPEAKLMATKVDAVIVAAGFDPETESEGADRTFSLPPGQNELIREIAAANPNTVVVITAGGGSDMMPWLDRVPAVLQAWYPGQEGGTALAEIVFGDVNPSGRLPVTFERRWEDNPAHDSYYPEAGTKRVVYKEGLFSGYRGFDHSGAAPLFPFGYGLSYTTFAYRNLSVSKSAATNQAASGQVEVQFDITNTGKREGADVAQVYVGSESSPVPRPAKELKGFAKVNLRPGETKRVTVLLDRRAFSFYDETARQWRAEPGRYDILVGRSAAAIELRGQFNLAGPTAMERTGP